MQHVRTSLVAGSIGTMGDLLMQYREGKTLPTEWDSDRTTRLVSFRMVHGPTVDSLWRLFDGALRARGVVGARNVASLVLLDQCLVGPPSIVAFFLSQGALEGKPMDECVERATSSFLPTFSIGMPYWCVIHSLTFSVIPIHLRMAWASTAAVFWNAIISKQNQLAIAREQQQQQQQTSAPSKQS